MRQQIMDESGEHSARFAEHNKPISLEHVEQANNNFGDADLACIAHLSPAAEAMLRVAIDASATSGQPLDRVKAIASMRRHALDGPFHLEFVCRTAIKIIDRRGHGVNGHRFRGVELAAFRGQHPQLERLTDAMSMFLVACQWWVHVKSFSATQHSRRPITTADLHEKLRRLGFLKREREALVRIICWRTRPRWTT